MHDLQQKALIWFQDHEAEMLETLYKLAEIRSVSDASAGKPGAPFGDGCRKVLDKAIEIAREMGFSAQDCEGYCATASTGDDAHAIGIAAHLDVVPEGGLSPCAALCKGSFGLLFPSSLFNMGILYYISS